LERETGNKLLKHSSDGGGKYTRNALKSFLEQEGVKQKLIKPYTQKQNGVAERENRTVESVRCSLKFL
jgi:transposase InsO family protein